MTEVETRKFKEFLEQTKDESEATTLWVKWKCLTDLFFLGYDILGMKEARDKRGRALVDPVFHRWLAGVLSTNEDVMVIVPRRHMKTTWVKVKLIQNILRDPFIRQALYSSTADLLEQELASIKRMLSNQKLIQLFPEIIPDPGPKGTGWQVNRASQLTIWRDPKGTTAPPQECQIEVFGIGGNPIGKHFDVHIYDDLVTDKNSMTMEQLNKTREWYGYIQGVLEPGGQEIYIGTPYHYEDLTNFIRKEKIFDNIYIRPVVENGKFIYSYFNEKIMNRLRKRMTPYQVSCNPGDAPIWMADGSFKYLRDIRVGEYVMGFTTGERSRLVSSRVIEKRSREAKTVTLQMESGRTIRCTPDHLWYAGQKSFHRGRPLYAKPAISGSRDWNRRGANGPYTTILQHAIEPRIEISIEEELKYQWLAGIIDGEGSCKHGSIIITQSNDKNPEVCKKIETTLNELGIKYSRWLRDERFGHKTADYFILNGGRNTKSQIIQHGKPAKSGQILSTMIGKKRPFDFADRIMAMVPNEDQETVFSMQTESGNYIAWGYGSKNCQYYCDPQPMEDQLFPPPQPQFDLLPAGKYNYYIAVDPAATVNTWSDETAVIVAAVNEMGYVFIVEAHHFKKTGDLTAEFILQLNEKYSPRKIGIEFGLQEHLRYIIDMKKSNWEAAQHKPINLPIEPIQITKRDKYDRINLTLGSFVRSRRIAIQSRLVDLMTQMSLYNKNYAGKDDLVDALSMIFSVVEQFSFRYWKDPLGIVKKGVTIMDLCKKKLATGYNDRFSK